MRMNIQGPLALRLGRLSNAVAARRDGEAVSNVHGMLFFPGWFPKVGAPVRRKI